MFKTNSFKIEVVGVKKVQNEHVVLANGDEHPLDDGQGTSYHETAEAARRAWVVFRTSQVEKAVKELEHFESLLAKAISYRI